MNNVRAGMLLPNVECDNAIDVKVARELTEEEKSFLESEEWTDLSYALSKIDDLDNKVTESVNNVKSVLNGFINEYDLTSEVNLDYRGLDEEVDKLLNDLKLSIKVEISRKQEKEEENNG